MDSGIGGLRVTPYMLAPVPATGEMRVPTMRQLAFLCDRTNAIKEVMYGGAAGGGKSDALLMAALQYVATGPGDSPELQRSVKSYRALILRRTYADLSLPGALMDRASEWLGPTDAKWNASEKTWVFPSGATLTFGYLEKENDKYRYQGANFHFIGFDEGTQFLEPQFRYLFSRLRKGAGDPIPLRMRMGSNPGGIGHTWVKQRYMLNTRGGRLFIPARLEDNPHLDFNEYVKALDELDPVTRRQLLMGDWNSENLGMKFRRSWFKEVRTHELPPQHELRYVRFWDFAATEPKPGIDPDYTVGLLMAFHPDSGFWYVLDCKRFRGSPGDVKMKFSEVAQDDHEVYDAAVTHVMEQEPGASGKHMVDDYMVSFPKHDIISFRPSGKKEVRANPVSSRIEAGRVYIVESTWNLDFYEELELFPYGQHDDQVDALSGAYLALADEGSPVVTVNSVPGMVEPVYETGDLRFVGEKYIDKA